MHGALASWRELECIIDGPRSVLKFRGRLHHLKRVPCVWMADAAEGTQTRAHSCHFWLSAMAGHRGMKKTQSAFPDADSLAKEIGHGRQS